MQCASGGHAHAVAHVIPCDAVDPARAGRRPAPMRLAAPARMTPEAAGESRREDPLVPLVWRYRIWYKVTGYWIQLCVQVQP